ncbi:hypothetical protein [Mycolicibacterium hodleri]|nr:hypothetical protein [Mycolicibacterium hodleri]
MPSTRTRSGPAISNIHRSHYIRARQFDPDPHQLDPGNRLDDATTFAEY